MFETKLLSTAAATFVLALSTTGALAATEKTPYIQIVTPTNCFDEFDCRVTFPATTAQTVIHNVACSYSITGGATIGFSQLYYSTSPTADTVVAVTLPISFTGAVGGGTLLNIGSNLQTLLFLNQGVAITVSLQVENGTFGYGGECVISGFTLG